MFNKNSFSISGPKPEGLKISRDDAGVPHIHANDMGGAMWGSGYAHAVDRGTQLMMMRILGKGRLCELLSDTDESLKIDRFFRRANWHHNLTSEVAKLDKNSLALCQAYCDGVNAGLASKKIYILKLMGYKPEIWTIQDSILISRMAGYLTLSQSQAEIERLFIELVQLGVSNDKLAELFPIDLAKFDRELIESIELQEKIVPNEVIWNQALPRMMASNNWVISGEKTKSGKPLMANDPHLEVNRLPNVWCEQSLKWSDKFIAGMGMPGLPGIVIGRTRHLAWGATYTFMDTVDSWVEDCKEGMYRQGDTWTDFTVRQEIIKRKKHTDDMMIFYENHHGVLDGDPKKTGKYLTTKWVAENSGARSLMASLKIAATEKAAEAMDHLGSIESAWNWVISDDSGNIAYQMSGLMPKRHAEWNGFMPAPGWDKAYDWKGIVSYKDLPNCINPKAGYIVTANQDLNHLGNTDPINMPMGDYRAKRLEAMLAKSNSHDVVTTKMLQFDVYSKQAEIFLNVLLPLLEESGEVSEAYDLLNKWDYGYGFESHGAPLFELFYEALRLQVFGDESVKEGGISNSVMMHLSQQTGVFIDFYQNFDTVILNEHSVWYENKSQKKVFLTAFDTAKRAHKGLPWRNVNTIRFTNMLLQGKLPRFMGFDSKNVSLLGGRATPHQGQIYCSGGRKTSFSPSVRLIADMNECDLHTSLAGGPSDNRFSRWYKSELQKWVEGEYKILKS
jgi:penicillin amidase